MTPAIPITLDLGLAFAASIVGILIVLFSRSVRVKRIILPITLAVFHLMVFAIIRRSGALASLPTLVLVALLALNAFYVLRVVRYCAVCGRTVQSSIPQAADGRCSECALANER